MVKEEVVYTTSDGKQYKTKKYAVRHENTLKMGTAGYTKEEVDDIIEEIGKYSKLVDIVLHHKPDWRDWESYHIKDLITLLDDHKQDLVTYKLYEDTWRGEKELLKVKEPRVEGGEAPKEFVGYAQIEEDENIHGATFTLELEEGSDLEKGRIIRYKLKENYLLPEEKIAKGIDLTEEDVRELVNEREELYVEEGENRRWSQSILTVVLGNDGNKYAINWERGLTENQEHSYYNQPYKVELETKEVVITKTIVTPVE